MEEAPNPDGGAPAGGAHSGGAQDRGGGDGGRATPGGGSVIDDLDELWPSRPSSAAAMLAKIWVDNPASSARFTCGFGGVDLDPELWDLRIHLDGVDNLERTLAREDITYMNIVALIETQGYSMRDSIYCVKVEGKGLEGMELIDNNAKIYEMLDLFESTQVLKLHVKRGRPSVRNNVRAGDSHTAVQQPGSCLINYQDSVVYDFSPPVVYAVDDDGQIFASQVDSTSCHNPYVCTQDSISDPKGKTINLEDEDAYHTDSSYDSSDFDMGEADFSLMEEMRKKEEMYVAEKIEEMRKKRLDPLLHCEGDSDVDDIFVAVEDKVAEEPMTESEQHNKKKLPVRRGPTLRSHSSVQIDVKPDYKPSSDEDSDPGFLEDIDDDGFEPISMVPPKGRKSRAKKMAKRNWYDERRLQPHEQLCIKMCFTNVQQFRDALIELHIAQSRNYRYHRNSDKRIIVHCIEEDCPFHMVGSEIKGEKTFVLRKMQLTHTCGTTNESSRVSAKWLATTYENLFRSDTTTNIQTLIDNAKQQFGVEVPKMMAYRAKNLALDAVLGDHREQYFRLRDYAQTVIDTNPGSRVIVQTVVPKPTEENPHPGPHFHGLFYFLNGPKEGFLNGCRPFIGLDGCFIKLCTGAQILAATGRDGNNNMYPLAFAIVGKEDTANWCWFLTQLKYALGGEEGQFGRYTIMSDRQKGLLKAVNQVFPNCPQRYCLRHIYANFQTAGFRGEDLKKCMDAASYAYTRKPFDVAMEKLKVESEEAWKWLSAIPVETWARHAFDTNCKTDLVVNNLSEVFNRYILDVRKKPIRTMIEGIRCKLMPRFHEKREGASQARWQITPTYSEKLEMEKKYSRYCTPIVSGTNLWEVTSIRSGQTHAVNFESRTCGCRKWDVTGIPCHHACAAIIKARQKPEDYVSNFFKKPMYEQAYKPLIYPVPGPHDWASTNTPDIVPPVFTINKGRKQEKRRKGKFEVPKPKDTSRMGTITCSNCKLQGHKYTSCTKELRPDLQMRKNKHVPCTGEGGPSGAAQPAAPSATPTQPAARQARDAAADQPVPRQTPAAQAQPAARRSPSAQAQRAAISAYAAPRSNVPDGEPAYKRSRTWGYFNCGYRAEKEPGQGDGPSNT